MKLNSSASIKIPSAVQSVLAGCTITESSLVLPPGQLERKLYEQVAKVIKLAGGVWRTRGGCFTFSTDPRPKLGIAITKGLIVDEKKLRQAFYTPCAVAEEVCVLAGVSGRRILEPSAGAGSLANTALRYGAEHVDCIEIEPSCRKDLEGDGKTVIIGDFLDMDPYRLFDLILMNPPYSKGQYIKHLTHALRWLKPVGAVFALVPDNDCPTLADLGFDTLQRFPSGAFNESGTGIATRLAYRYT